LGDFILKKKDKILIAGAHGMVGSALHRCFQSHEYSALLTPTRQEVDYANQEGVRLYLQEHRPDVVVVAAAKVGGIWANMTYPAEFIYMNLMITCNLIHESHVANVPRLLYLGSSCIYPRQAPQPIPEGALLSAPLEKTNEAYALAKICGVKMCEYYRRQYGRSYISAMPTNLYGPKDNYHPENAHVIPALIGRFHEAKLNNSPEVSVWGRGSALREFLYVEDLANACLHLLQHYDEPTQINVGSEEEVSIKHLAKMIASVVGYQGKITYDLSKPDGTPRKKIDIGRILALGWRPTIPLQEGLEKSYADFLANGAHRSRSLRMP
jgi:GDP-L-fucose synthase